MKTIGYVAILVAIAFIYLLYVSRNYKRESYTNPYPGTAPTEKVYQQEKDSEGSGCSTVLDTSLDRTKPYVTDEDKQGDFEQDFVYQNEGGSDPTLDALNAARRRFPFDWSQLPPSSSLFQAQQALFVKDPTTTAAPFTKETYSDIEAENVLPPDMDKVNQAMEDELKAYAPPATASYKAVDEPSVNELIQKIYGKKGLVARVAKNEKIDNVFEVYATEDEKPKIVYEDDTYAKEEPNALMPMVEPEQQLVVPNAAKDIARGVPPSATGMSTRDPRQSYSDYNPNLEGIFGPKLSMQQWG